MLALPPQRWTTSSHNLIQAVLKRYDEKGDVSLMTLETESEIGGVVEHLMGLLGGRLGIVVRNLTCF